MISRKKASYESLLRRKAALGQDMVSADENGNPRVVSARRHWKNTKGKRTPISNRFNTFQWLYPSRRLPAINFHKIIYLLQPIVLQLIAWHFAPPGQFFFAGIAKNADFSRQAPRNFVSDLKQF